MGRQKKSSNTVEEPRGLKAGSIFHNRNCRVTVEWKIKTWEPRWSDFQERQPEKERKTGFAAALPVVTDRSSCLSVQGGRWARSPLGASPSDGLFGFVLMALASGPRPVDLTLPCAERPSGLSGLLSVVTVCLVHTEAQSLKPRRCSTQPSSLRELGSSGALWQTFLVALLKSGSVFFRDLHLFFFP